MEDEIHHKEDRRPAEPEKVHRRKREEPHAHRERDKGNHAPENEEGATGLRIAPLFAHKSEGMDERG